MAQICSLRLSRPHVVYKPIWLDLGWVGKGVTNLRGWCEGEAGHVVTTGHKRAHGTLCQLALLQIPWFITSIDET